MMTNVLPRFFRFTVYMYNIIIISYHIISYHIISLGMGVTRRTVITHSIYCFVYSRKVHRKFRQQSCARTFYPWFGKITSFHGTLREVMTVIETCQFTKPRVKVRETAARTGPFIYGTSNSVIC